MLHLQDAIGLNSLNFMSDYLHHSLCVSVINYGSTKFLEHAAINYISIE